MSSQDNDEDSRVVAAVVIVAVLLAVGVAVGVGIQKARGGGAAATATVSAPAAPGDASAAAMPVLGDDASVVVENGVVKFYFASGKADLASGALDALGDAIAAAKAGKQLVISGFHDATGDAAFNAELAKQRAVGVRDALMGAGVTESSIELKKPEETTGSGNNAEARRVEVTIAE
jgi:outer membrane protein OmpA-like peptidoglycan-associated protein